MGYDNFSYYHSYFAVNYGLLGNLTIYNDVYYSLDQGYKFLGNYEFAARYRIKDFDKRNYHLRTAYQTGLVNGFSLSEIKDHIEKSGKKGIVYVSSNYRFNPQFSFYFNGLNLGWEDPQYGFELIENNDKDKNFINTKSALNNYIDKDFFLIIEKDNINRAPDYDPELFVPDYYQSVIKKTGYELYEKKQ